MPIWSQNASLIILFFLLNVRKVHWIKVIFWNTNSSLIENFHSGSKFHCHLLSAFSKKERTAPKLLFHEIVKWFTTCVIWRTCKRQKFNSFHNFTNFFNFFHDFLLLIQPDCKTCDIPSFIPYVVIHNDSYKLGSISLVNIF